MTKTEQWLRTRFHDEAQTVAPPSQLHEEVMRRATSTTRKRREPWPGLAVSLAVALAAVVVFAVNAIHPSGSARPADSAQVPTTWTFDLAYLINETETSAAGAWSMTTESVTVPNTGAKAWDVVQALLNRVPTGRVVNGFNYFPSLEPSPIADVNSVTVGDVITVDLDRSVWDPYPTIDCDCPPGAMVMQQLVWSLNGALGTNREVLLTINGHPAQGIWLHELDGPVQQQSLRSLQEGLSEADSDKPGIFWNCQSAEIRPESVVLACADGGLRVSQISWSEWTPRHAMGVGLVIARRSLVSATRFEATVEFFDPRQHRPYSNGTGTVFTKVRITSHGDADGWPNHPVVRSAL